MHHAPTSSSRDGAGSYMNEPLSRDLERTKATTARTAVDIRTAGPNAVNGPAPNNTNQTEQGGCPEFR